MRAPLSGQLERMAKNKLHAVGNQNNLLGFITSVLAEVYECEQSEKQQLWRGKSKSDSSGSQLLNKLVCSKVD